MLRYYTVFIRSIILICAGAGLTSYVGRYLQRYVLGDHVCAAWRKWICACPVHTVYPFLYFLSVPCLQLCRYRPKPWYS